MPITPTATGVGQKTSDGCPHVIARDQWNYTRLDLSVDASQVISAVPAEIGGIYVDTALSAHACPVLDGASPAFSLIASLAAGSQLTWCRGMRFETNLQVNSDDAATGVIVVLWRPI